MKRPIRPPNFSASSHQIPSGWTGPANGQGLNVQRAFEAGWGGAVWKRVGDIPPIVNVSGPRYGAIHGNDRRVIGFNKIERITDPPLGVNSRKSARSSATGRIGP